MHTHVKDDKVITEKEVKTIENKLNKKVDGFLKMTNAGQATGQTKRIKSNTKTKDNQIPVVSATSKDHKKDFDVVSGPDVRAICGAMVGPNVGISNLTCEVVRRIADEANTGYVSKSTEETINKIEKYNESRKDLIKADDKLSCFQWIL